MYPMTTTTEDSKETILRPLGANEHVVDYYMHRNPTQFSLVAEVTTPVTAQTLGAALKQLQQRHPLLAVAVTDSATPAAAFRKTDRAVPVEERPAGTPWQAVVADEQTRPIPPEPGPLVRAVLVPAQAGSTVVLTFAHQISDGVGGLQALLDLVSVLDGATLAAGDVPQPQEELLARQGVVTRADAQADPGTQQSATAAGRAAPDGGAAAPDGIAAAPPEADARMGATGELLPFTGRTPHLTSLALDSGLTSRLVARARSEQSSVHAALCAAASLAFHRRGREFVRVLSPMDLRRAVGLPAETVVRFAGAKTASDGRDGDDLWSLARSHHRALSAQRTPQAIAEGSAVLAEQAPDSPEGVEAMMAAATAADIQITNLGVAQPHASDTGILAALWGPAQLTQLRGEHLLGVVTVNGRLRMTELTHDPLAGLVTEIATLLAEACAEPNT